MFKNSVSIKAEKVIVTIFRKELSNINKPNMKIITPLCYNIYLIY
jgi:hypothetical protein